MSLIHEALKKAEQQRQLGTAPTLGSPVRVTRHGRPWLGPLLALAAAVILVAVAWWWLTGRRAQSGPAPASVAATSSHPQAKPAASAVAHPGASAPNRTARPPIAPAPAQKPATAPKSTPTSAAGTIARTPATKTPRQPAPPAKAATKRPATPRAPATPGHRAAKPTVVKLEPPPPPRPKPVVKASRSKLPLYWELPYAERSKLPAFKISMHVYSPTPSKRFVILNGDRHVEGDDLGDGLKLKAIDPSGIVVELNGKAFRVPRDGGY